MLEEDSQRRKILFWNAKENVFNTMTLSSDPDISIGESDICVIMAPLKIIYIFFLWLLL